MADLTSEGERLVKTWLNSRQELARAKSTLARAECEMLNAQRSLAKWMLPDDAKPGEKISVWYVDSLIQVEVRQNADHVVTIRTRGRHLDRP